MVGVVGQWTGHETRLLRRALRMTIAEFADHLGVTTRAVDKWEARGASITPRPELQRALDTVLSGADPAARARLLPGLDGTAHPGHPPAGAPPEAESPAEAEAESSAVGGSRWPTRPVDLLVHSEPQPTATADPPTTPAVAAGPDAGSLLDLWIGRRSHSGLAAVEAALEHALHDDRTFMTLSGSALAAIVHQWLRVEPGEVRAACRGAVIDDDFVDRLEAGLPRLRTLEATHGGLRARRLIDAELGMVAEVLARSSFSTSLGRRLYSLAAELGRRAGWACFDAGLHAAADTYWVAALRAARSADDVHVGANILKSMSLQCHDFGDYRSARLLAHAARTAAADAGPRFRAMLDLREARAHAAMGDRRACESLIGRADSELSRGSGDEDEPDALAYFDDAEARAQIGTCYLDLDLPRLARPHFQAALDEMSGTKPRDRTTYLACAARAHAALGDADEACRLLVDAAGLVETIPSRRNLRKILDVRGLLPTTAPGVAAMDEQLHTLLV